MLHPVYGAVKSTESPESPIAFGTTPAEFDGRDDWWSPEALLLGSVSLCVETTFTAMARRKELEILEWTSHAEGVVDKTAQGLAFTSIHVKADLVVRSDDVERARALADVVGRHCLVGSSLKCPVTVAVDVTGRGPHDGFRLVGGDHRAAARGDRVREPRSHAVRLDRHAGRSVEGASGDRLGGRRHGAVVACAARGWSW